MAEKFAIVTGASSGIGLSLAKELAARGYDLAICSSGGRLPAAAEQLRPHGVQVTDIQADLATQDGVKQFWDQVAVAGPKHRCCLSQCRRRCRRPFRRNRFGRRIEYGVFELRGYRATCQIRGSKYALAQ